MPPIRTATRAVMALRIHCPVATDTLAQLLSGNTDALERDSHGAALLRAIRTQPILGDFGLYRSVIELAPGWEMFTPAVDAVPTLGTPGERQMSPTVILSVHIAADTPPEALDAAFAALLAAHPWETPVIELIETQLLIRD